MWAVIGILGWATPGGSSASWRRRTLLSLARSGSARRVVQLLPPVERSARRRAGRYIAGGSIGEAVAAAKRIQLSGLAVCVERLGELVDHRRAVTEAVSEQIDLARQLNGVGGDTTLGVDLTQLGLEVSPAYCLEQMERIAAEVAPMRIDVGAREYVRTEMTNEVILELARRGIPVQMTLQANLRRSATDWPLLVQAGAGIRLVKGAFAERLDVAYPYGKETDAAYRRLASELHAAGAYLALATHDRALRDHLLVTLGPIDCELLLGVAEADARRLAAEGIPVRIHVPFGTGWFRYWLRRVAEARGS